MPKNDHHDFPPEPEPRRRVPAGHALVVILVALLVGALLNSERIDRTAHTQPFGWQRTWAVRVTGPLAAAGRVTRLDRPRRWLADATDHKLPPAPAKTETVDTAPPTTAGPASTTTTTIARRVPTADDPVRILVAGDSLMGWVGPGLSEGLDNDLIDITDDSKPATGLARPDYFNWPARLEEDVAQHDPEVVVLGFGGNDAQAMNTDDGYVQPGTPEWAAEYQRRVAQMLQIVEGPNRSVYWIGLPVTSQGNIEAAAPAMREAETAEIDARPWAHFVDSRETLSPDGTFTAYLPDDSGGQVKVREADGVHPNIAGARRLVAPLIELIAKDRKLS